jgi:UDP-N-acetylmuramyl tripeptide synthase
VGYAPDSHHFQDLFMLESNRPGIPSEPRAERFGHGVMGRDLMAWRDASSDRIRTGLNSECEDTLGTASGDPAAMRIHPIPTFTTSGDDRSPRRHGVPNACDWSAAVAGRAVGRLSRFMHLGSGSTLPGRVVQAVDHGFLARRGAALADGSVVVSGTNGKTTTASMLQTILRAEGLSLVANRSGSNLRGGVVSAFVAADFDARMGVLEVDEAALPSMVAELQPRLLVLMNIFRDQLDRFAEPENVALLLRRAAEALPPRATVIANGDDPLLWSALEHLHPVGFSVVGESASHQANPSESEPDACFRCEGELRFTRRTMAHLGSARCPTCGWASSDAAYTARIVAQAGLDASVFEVCGELVTLPLGGIHNAYNAVAAIAASTELGIHPARAVAALESFHPRFGRAETISFNDRRLWLTLIKNPAGAGAVIREVCADRRVGAVLVAVSDRDADGRDVSWIWDADFEQLTSLSVPMIAGGRRAADAAVRMKYAGNPPHAVETDPLVAVQTAAEQCPPDGIIVVLSTYTAMLDLREVLTGDRTTRAEDGMP